MVVRYYVWWPDNPGLVRERFPDDFIYISDMEKIAVTLKKIESSKFATGIPAGSIVIYNPNLGCVARVTPKGVSNLWFSSRSISRKVSVLEWKTVKWSRK